MNASGCGFYDRKTGARTLGRALLPAGIGLVLSAQPSFSLPFMTVDVSGTLISDNNIIGLNQLDLDLTVGVILFADVPITNATGTRLLASGKVTETLNLPTGAGIGLTDFFSRIDPAGGGFGGGIITFVSRDFSPGIPGPVSGTVSLNGFYTNTNTGTIALGNAQLTGLANDAADQIATAIPVPNPVAMSPGPVSFTGSAAGTVQRSVVDNIEGQFSYFLGPFDNITLPGSADVAAGTLPSIDEPSSGALIVQAIALLFGIIWGARRIGVVPALGQSGSV
jgi:hypothetical protein